MPAGFSQQIDRVTTGTINTVADNFCGGPASLSGAARYSSQAGERIILGPETLRSNVASGVVYPGAFQYVQILSTAATALARGGLVYWSDRENFIVTPDVTTANIHDFAGVLLNGASNPVVAGQWTFIQIMGKVFVKFKAATTKATPAIGDIVVTDNTPSNTADVLADATTFTGPLLKTVIGNAVVQAPVGAGLTPVELLTRGFAF